MQAAIKNTVTVSVSNSLFNIIRADLGSVLLVFSVAGGLLVVRGGSSLLGAEGLCEADLNSLGHGLDCDVSFSGNVMLLEEPVKLKLAQTLVLGCVSACVNDIVSKEHVCEPLRQTVVIATNAAK